jgi:hypothetical protein
MREQLQGFVDLAEHYDQSRRPGRIGDDTILEHMLQREPTIKQILKMLDPVLADFHLGTMTGERTAKAQAQRGLGILADRDEWRVRLAPDAPTLPADQLHPWVWDAAHTFWESQHFRAAVQTASASINDHLQQKIGRRDVADDQLIQQTFSPEPPAPGRPRLRIPGDRDNPTVQSTQRGSLQFGLGCFWLIRNPATHETGELPEQEAARAAGRPQRPRAHHRPLHSSACRQLATRRPASSTSAG